MRPTICLNMIVKDEAPVIRRCLDSVRPFIDTWVIVDTGSTDGTQDLVRTHFADVPGELHERPWRNFGHNRTEALVLARNKADYTFVIDADEVLELPEGWARPELGLDAYDLRLQFDHMSYDRICLVANRLPWRYEGVLHEYLATDRLFSHARLEGPVVRVSPDGARTRDTTPEEKYRRDAAVLEAALVDEPNNARYVFYLAQSYRDSGQTQRAVDTYRRRAGMGGWDEEVWCSLYQVGKLSERLGLEPATVVHRYLTAYQNRPTRVEPLVELARFHRLRGEWALAHLFAAQAVCIERPADRLFVVAAHYDWMALDEYAIASYWIGEHRECQRACQELLDSPLLPDHQRERIATNLAWAEKQLAGGA